MTLKRAELKRKSKPKEKKSQFVDGPVPYWSSDAPRAAFHRAARDQGVCAVTKKGGHFQAHHVVAREEIKRWKGDEWDPRDALRLGVHVHEQHTNAFRKVRLDELTDASIEFAFELMGKAAYVYLKRKYSGFDSRVELALVEATHAPK